MYAVRCSVLHKFASLHLLDCRPSMHSVLVWLRHSTVSRNDERLAIDHDRFFGMLHHDTQRLLPLTDLADCNDRVVNVEYDATALGPFGVVVTLINDALQHVTDSRLWLECDNG